MFILLLCILRREPFIILRDIGTIKMNTIPPGGEIGCDLQETKLPTYWNTSFSKICLGMKIGQQINFIVINKQANSLCSLIADGQHRVTSLGRDMWKTLIGSQASLQLNCNITWNVSIPFVLRGVTSKQ